MPGVHVVFPPQSESSTTSRTCNVKERSAPDSERQHRFRLPMDGRDGYREDVKAKVTSGYELPRRSLRKVGIVRGRLLPIGVPPATRSHDTPRDLDLSMNASPKAP